MRLVSCYIENFGKLHRFSYDFQEGLNVICEENGWGKTTLAAFLKAMFYGMECTTKHKLEENERKKYLPWNGGAYGGNLVFEANDKVYRAERFWGIKDKEDTFVLYNEKTGLTSTDYTEDLGEELFGIDRGAFEQSIFMKQGMPATGMTDSIATKMSGLMAGGDDMDCYAKACTRLENEMKIYKSKKTESKGKIAELSGEINELGRRISEAKKTGAVLKDWKEKQERCKEETEGLKAKRAVLKEQMRKAGELAVLREKQKHYQLLWTEKEKLWQRVEALDLFFGNGLPEEEELEQYRTKLYLYNHEIPKEEVAETKFRYPDLAAVLEKYPMTEEELDVCERKWQLLREKEKYLAEKEAQVEKLRSQEEERKRYYKTEENKVKSGRIIGIAVAALLLIAVVIMLLAHQWFYASVAAVLVLVPIIICVGQQRRFYAIKTEQNKDLESAEAELEALKKTLENGKKAMQMYFRAFSVETLEEMPVVMNRIRITLMEVKAENNRKIQQKETADRCAFEKENLHEELLLFLRKFYSEVTEVEESLFKEIAQKRSEYLSLSRQYEEKCAGLTQMEPMEELPEGQVFSPEELQQKEYAIEQKIQSNEEHLRQMNATVSQYTTLMEDCEKWEMEKAEMEELLEEYHSKYSLLEKTLKYLQTAQEEFSSRYLKKINAGYRNYAGMLHEDNLNHSTMDSKLAIKTDEGGSKRELAYFSRGTKEAMELCSRFALVDALFEEETPFVVLDDPFVNFDEKTMSGGMQALEQIARKYQLIYFTCHSSRK